MHTIVWLSLILLPVVTCAQIKNIKLDDVEPYQPAIVVNKKNPLNIVAASEPNNIFYTVDGGNNWQSIKLKSSLSVNGDPALISDDKGNIYSFHMTGKAAEQSGDLASDQIICHISKDGGKTWEEGAPFALNGSKVQKNPTATIDVKGNIWVAWTQFDKFRSDDKDCQSNVFLTASSNGKKWSKPIHVSQLPGDCADDDNSVKGPVPAISADGKAFVAWANQNKLFLDRSFNGGDLWLSNDITVGQQPGGWRMAMEGHASTSGHPVLMIDQSKSMYQGCLYLMWADQRNGENNTDVWFMRSTNFGDNWSSPVKVAEDTSKRHQYLPTMAVDQSTGYIYAVFYDRSAYSDNQTDVCVAYSTDGGINFKTTRISDTPFVSDEEMEFTDYIGISAHKGTITPIWTRVENGKASLWTAIIKQNDLIQVPQASGKKKKK